MDYLETEAHTFDKELVCRQKQKTNQRPRYILLRQRLSLKRIKLLHRYKGALYALKFAIYLEKSWSDRYSIQK